MSDSFSSFRERLEYLERMSGKNKKKEKRETHAFTLSSGWEKSGDFTFKKSVEQENPLTLADFSRLSAVPGQFKQEDLLFFDIETTGLSGGAGNICFLIGIGRIIASKLVIEQYFLSDFPGEPEFLQAIASFFSNKYLLVSYNGKSFDSHLLTTRFLMNRMECSTDYQFDLLHISRRLFKKKIGSCSLSDIEEKVLNIHRENDVDGFEVPDIYFSFLKTGHTDELERVFTHNYQDIFSLVYLFDFIVNVMCSKAGKNLSKVDIAALGKYLLESGKEEGINLIEHIFHENNDADAGAYLSLHYKKDKEWEKARKIWEKHANEKKSIFAAVELSKYYEHQAKDFEKALFWVEKIFGFHLPLSKEERMDFMKRKERILKKMEKKGN